ncbi:ATP-binding cassette domain-containing protein [Halorubrum vacuolatum]|uniref:Cobalamin import ATP-binding protein BtuD n=1 Tax=Halorubrum vacuolatum TaxID=63740 RepID=A0A238VDQ3_HALVU|nr:ATP-binding cassette domain-containing protein [Halorubrum vacuolatum]SNR32376.1 iron complex transport system ATP-binding protein [Halorubrum vacuolatum]
MIEVRELTVAFGDEPVFSDVDLTVDRGTFVGLVGPNGAGKTTLLRAIKGTLKPDRGTVRLAGDPLSTLSAKAVGRRVASVPQSTTLSFDFPVRNVVEMGRTPHIGRFGSHDADDVSAVEEAMAATGVARFADRPITEVSGGERGRVLLARAIAQGTPALLLDEPTASLDVNHAVRTLELVRGFVDDGRTAVAAIHDLEMAARYCDVVVLIADGGIQAVGAPHEVFTAESIRASFDAEAFVGTDPTTGSPAVTTYPTSETDPRRVHVVGIGRPTARVVARLVAAGHDLSVGVVPATGAVAGVAADADVPAVTVPPFEDPERSQVAAAADLAADADVVIVVGEPHEHVRPVTETATPTVQVPADVDPTELLETVAAATPDEGESTDHPDGSAEAA